MLMLNKRLKSGFLLGDYFYKKITRWKLARPLMPSDTPAFSIDLSSDFDSFGDKYLRKLDEDIAKLNGEKK